ncbi:hypothetical protein AMECASPLE_026772 [Ameca splendens]|uniref:Uncharacterized protein n=1 Tax=Ameca splendens TaxID=208324 RepID=A0ABV0YGG5_9TELE
MSPLQGASTKGPMVYHHKNNPSHSRTFVEKFDKAERMMACCLHAQLMMEGESEGCGQGDGYYTIVL